MCAPRWKVGFISSAYFLGWCATLLWVPLLADKLGRRYIFIFGVVFDLLMYTGILITGNLNVMIALTFFEGMSASCTQTAGWVYMMELLPLHRQAIIAAIYASWDSSITYLLVTIYFVYVSNHWFPLTFFGYVLQAICACLVWLLPESPKLLVELNRFDEAERALRRIAWFGGTEFDPMSLNDINNGARQSIRAVADENALMNKVDSVLSIRNSKIKTSGIYDDEVKVPAPPIMYFLKQRTIFTNLMVLLIIWVGTVYNSYLITYLLNTLGQVYVNYVCSSFSALIAYSMGGFIFLKVGLKLSIGGSALLAFIGGVLILAIGL